MENTKISLIRRQNNRKFPKLWEPSLAEATTYIHNNPNILGNEINNYSADKYELKYLKLFHFFLRMIKQIDDAAW